MAQGQITTMWRRVLCLGILVGASSCGYISDDELKDRLDADNDGLPRMEDCDDSDPSITVFMFYVDLDQDTYGDPTQPMVEGCEVRDGLSEVGGDCDDTRPWINPSRSEICNQLDDDCNGRSDDDVEDLRTYYQDADGDGFGDAADPVSTCFPPDGYVNNDRDCNDDDPATFGGSSWFRDRDADGWGDPRSMVSSCASPSTEFIARGGDCDDDDPEIHPGAAEVCDDEGRDEDCDLVVNDADDSVDISTGEEVWRDADGDGLGNAGEPGALCDPELDPRWVSNRDDCDDRDPAILDEDCPYTRVSAGTTASCAVRGDLRIVCWGMDSITLHVPEEGTFTDVGVGFSHACGLRREGTVECWGELGPVAIESLDVISAIACESTNTCSLTEESDLQCWQDDKEYRLGIAGQYFQDFTVGPTHSCGLLDNREVSCIGSCDSGECTIDDGPWYDLAAGRNFTCGIGEAQDIACWGDMEVLPPAGVFDTLGAYGKHICASGAEGIPTCWTSNRSTPALMPPSVSFLRWDVGAGHGCGIVDDGRSIECWGNNFYGQAEPPD